MPHLLRDLLPRFHDDVARTLGRERPALLAQLARLQIVGRCNCGMDGCLSFHCESADAALAPLSGRRPLGYPLDHLGGWYFVAPGDVLTGFELLDDYPDHYLAAQLARAGLVPEPEDDEDGGCELGTVLVPPPSGLAAGGIEDDDAPMEGDTLVVMTPAATRHAVEMQRNDRGFGPEEVVEMIACAMDDDASMEPAPVTRSYSMLGTAMQRRPTGRVLRPRLMLRRTAAGFEVRGMVPEAVSGPALRQ